MSTEHEKYTKDLKERKANIKILLVEDNEIIRRVNKGTLEKLGYAYEVAEDGEQALAMWEKTHYDLILLDLEMPKKTGQEVLKIIRQNEEGTGKHIPILIYSTNNEEHVKDIEGADGFLSKPALNNEVLDKKILSLLKIAKDVE